MAVPEHVRKVPRPTNTVVVDQGRDGPRRYAVRSRAGIVYVPGGNPQPRNGKIIGHIVDGRFVSLNERLIENEPLMHSFGAAALVHSVADDILRDLEAIYAADEARQILSLAILRVLKPGLTATRVQTEYHRTFVSVFYPRLSLSASSIGKLKKKLGENEKKRLKFYERRMQAVMADHHIAIDGTLRQDSSTVNDLSAYSRKAAARGYPEVSILYAYDVEFGEPICATVYPGNVIDQSTFSSFVRDNQIKQGTIVADKGFTIERLRTELEKNPDLHYLIPLKQNDRRIAAHDMTTFEGMLRGIDEQVLYKKVPLGDGRFLYSFRDRSRAAAEEATYLQRVKTKGKVFDFTDYEKNREKGGLIVFESDLDMDPLLVYKTYSERWLIELVFRRYKNEVNLNKTQVQGDFSVWGDEFLNFIATLLTCRVVRRLEQAKLLDDASYSDVMDDLSSAWRRSDAMGKPCSDDDAWVHTTKRVLAMLEALGLSEPAASTKATAPAKPRGRPRLKPEFVGPKRPRGRPRKIKTEQVEATTETTVSSDSEAASVKRKPGRPKGSKNKKKPLPAEGETTTEQT